MACVGLSQVKRRKWKRSVFNETSAASAILKSALNITTTCDSYYQTTNKRKNNNHKVLISMDKLKICFIWLRTPHVFPLSNLKRIPSYSSSTDKQRNTEPFTQMMNYLWWHLEKYQE